MYYIHVRDQVTVAMTRGLHIHRGNITLWLQLQLSVFIFLSTVVSLPALLSQLPAVLSFIILMSSALCWPVGSLWLRIRAGTEQPQTKICRSYHLEQRRNMDSCGEKKRRLTLLAEDGWCWVLVISLGQHRCQDASGQFPAVCKKKSRPISVRTNKRLNKMPLFAHQNNFYNSVEMIFYRNSPEHFQPPAAPASAELGPGGPSSQKP